MKISNRSTSAALAAMLLVSGTAQAASAVENTGVSLFVREGQSLQSRKLIPFLNFGLGYSSMNTQENPGDLSGSHFRLGALGSYRSDHWIGDLGAGWFRNSISGSSKNYSRGSILTRAGYADASVRFRLSDPMSIGPVLEAMYGPDISYSFSSSPKSFLVFGGVQGVYELPKQTVDMRFLARLSTDFTLPERQLTTFMVGFQVGMPWTEGHVRYASDSRSRQRAGKVSPSISYFAPLDQVNFPVGSADLNVDSETFLESVARAFIEEGGSWDKIEIAGHCDERGSYEFNQKLSEKRAKAVARILTRAGIKSNRLEILGYSYTQPEDARSIPEAWAKNRRVELKVHGDPAAMDMLGKKLKTYRFETGGTNTH